MYPDPPQRRAEDRHAAPGRRPSARIGDDIREAVLEAVRRANRDARTITTWDLPRLTGLPLHAASVAVRKLEVGRLLTIDDNPSDPFGATLMAVEVAAAPAAVLPEKLGDARRVA